MLIVPPLEAAHVKQRTHFHRELSRPWQVRWWHRVGASLKMLLEDVRPFRLRRKWRLIRSLGDEPFNFPRQRHVPDALTYLVLKAVAEWTPVHVSVICSLKTVGQLMFEGLTTGARSGLARRPREPSRNGEAHPVASWELTPKVFASRHVEVSQAVIIDLANERAGGEKVLPSGGDNHQASRGFRTSDRDPDVFSNPRGTANQLEQSLVSRVAIGPF